MSCGRASRDPAIACAIWIPQSASVQVCWDFDRSGCDVHDNVMDCRQEVMSHRPNRSEPCLLGPDTKADNFLFVSSV